MWVAGGWAEAKWFAEIWVVHVQHVQWQLLSSYQAVPDFPDDQTCCVGGWKCGEQAKTALVKGVLSQTTSDRLSKTQAVTR